MAADLPVRVAVISRSPVVRLGLVGLVAQLHGKAVVTDAYETREPTDGECDVAIFDVGSVSESDASLELQHLASRGIHVISLVYDASMSSVSTRTATPVVTLSVTPDELLSAVRRVMDPQAPGGHSTLPSGLTEREFTVMAHVAEGLSNKDIAERLFISVNSVKTYIRSAYRKIGVDTRPAAMLWGLRHGLAAAPEDPDLG